ncbi:MAG: hypothetical protein BMS9Abin13_471 [Patescibacteria group bacterium]|nr:MAG: hypothetical protein BMS9Abin13_471 [Patescibacteria group bacterium]
MLNVFPDLLTYSLLAPFLIRISLGLIFIYFAYLKFSTERERKTLFFEHIGLKPGIIFVWIVGAVELIAGVLLVVGLYTQIAALAATALMSAAVVIKLRHKNALPNDAAFYILLSIASLSIIFSGAGFFAIDLPL